MIVWDWNDIVIFGGGWWLLLIAIAVAVVFYLIGYGIGYKRAKDRYETWPTDHIDRPLTWGED